MRTLCATLAIGLIAVSTAMAAHAQMRGGEVAMQALLDDDGSGRLFVNNPDGPWRWESCTPRLTECRQVAGGRELSTRGVRPPAVFRVRSEGLVGISPEWRGRPEQIAPPSTAGLIRANEFVSPMPGRWARGWEAEQSELQLSACRTAAGKVCTTLTHSHYVRRDCSLTESVIASFVIPAEFAGQYLRVAERRLGAGPIVRLAYAVGSPYGHPVWRRNRVTSAAVVGRIASPTRDFPGECGPPVPSEGSISKGGLRLVRCSEDCRATLIAGREGRAVRAKRTVAASRGSLFAGPPEQIALPPGRWAKLGEGPITVALRVDGRLQDIRRLRAAP
jgi:hypothetical protein